MDEEKKVVTEVECDFEWYKAANRRQSDEDGNEFYYIPQPNPQFLKHHLHPYKWRDIENG